MGWVLNIFFNFTEKNESTKQNLKSNLLKILYSDNFGCAFSTLFSGWSILQILTNSDKFWQILCALYIFSGWKAF
jgi:hypothetical protein